MEFPNLHIYWTEGKNLPLPDLVTTQDEHRLRTGKICDSIKFFMTHNLQKQPIQCHSAVSYYCVWDQRSTTQVLN